VVEVVLDLEQARHRHDLVAVDEAVRDAAARRETARHGEEVRLPEPLGALVGEPVHDVGVREPVHRVELDVAAGVVTGWYATERPAGCLIPKRTMSTSSWSLRSRSIAATRVTFRPNSAQWSRAFCLALRRSRPRISVWVRSSNPSNCM